MNLPALIVRSLTPNATLDGWRPKAVILGGWLSLWLLFWIVVRPAIFPSPLDVVVALPALWTIDGLGQHLITSLTVSVEALVLSSLISLPLAYLSRVPAIRPIGQWVAEMRFLSPAVFFLMLLFIAPSGHMVKVLMLTMGETFFLVTTMIGVVDAVPLERFDDCRTLRMNEGQALWYAVVRGTLHDAILAIRDNNAMGWSMLMMVEGIVRSEGGVGVMILNNEKHMNFAEVYAIATVIALAGLAMDYLLGQFELLACPYIDRKGRR